MVEHMVYPEECSMCTGGEFAFHFSGGWPLDLEGLQRCSGPVFTPRSFAWRPRALLKVGVYGPTFTAELFLQFSIVLHVARAFAVRYMHTYNHYIFLMDRALYRYKVSLSLVTETFALKALLPNFCTATQLFKLTPASCFACIFKKIFWCGTF